jgi:hypothetical protein
MADMAEATEFVHLANKYQVHGVPRTVINESTHVLDALAIDRDGQRRVPRCDRERDT